MTARIWSCPKSDGRRQTKELDSRACVCFDKEAGNYCKISHTLFFPFPAFTPCTFELSLSDYREGMVN
jgi:hypothetical protein